MVCINSLVALWCIINSACPGKSKIKYVFSKCHQLQSPGRDKETNERLEDISELIISGNATFGSVVPLFIRNANYCLDLIYKDIENLSDVLKQANR